MMEKGGNGRLVFERRLITYNARDYSKRRQNYTKFLQRGENAEAGGVG